MNQRLSHKSPLQTLTKTGASRDDDVAVHFAAEIDGDALDCVGHHLMHTVNNGIQSHKLRLKQRFHASVNSNSAIKKYESTLQFTNWKRSVSSTTSSGMLRVSKPGSISFPCSFTSSCASMKQQYKLNCEVLLYVALISPPRVQLLFTVVPFTR